MAAPKSKHPAERSRASEENTLASILSAFFLARLAPDSGRSSLCVALSGGRDSVVLLHALNQLSACSGIPFSVSAVHVHHGISPNADDWVRFCSDLCHHLSVPLDIVRVTVPIDSGEGLEGAARRIRHAVFERCAADFLALAHHRDDQAETVLLNLLRGAGIAGAAGMLAERPQARGPILVRPLLDVPRVLIDHYAAEHGLRWIDDESNNDLHFRRNFLRHQIMPQLEEKFPGAQTALARAAGHFAESAGLLDDLAAVDRAALATPSGRLGLAGLNRLPPARARNILRFAWIAAGFRAPDTRWISEALRQLGAATEQSEICVATQDGELHVYRGELHLVERCRRLPGESVLWAGEGELPWAGRTLLLIPSTGSGIRRNLFVESEIRVKCRQGGERLQPDAKRPRRSLRNLLQEAAIPPWERARLPCLWCDEKLAWVGGIGIDAAFACAEGQDGILPLWEFA